MLEGDSAAEPPPAADPPPEAVDETPLSADQEARREAQRRPYLLFELQRDNVTDFLGGGLPRRSLIMMMGEYGSGKSILSQRLLYGLLRNHHSVTYVSTELTVKGFLDQMFSLNYVVGPYILNRQLHFYSIHQLTNPGEPLFDPLATLEQAANLYTNEVLIFDTLSFLAHCDYDPTRATHLMSFFKRVVTNGLTVLFTIETAEMEQRELIPFCSSSEVLLELEQQVTANEALCHVQVKRFARPMSRVGNAFAFRVEPRSGIIAETIEIT